MPWIAAAASVAGGLLASSGSASAAGKAANAQTQASQAAIAEQQREFNATQANNAPFLATGTAANARLAQLLGLDTGAANGSNMSAAHPTEWSNTWHKYSDPYGYVDQNNPAYSDILKSTISDMNGQGFTTPNPAASSPDFGSLSRKFSASDLAADPVYNSGLQFGLDQGVGAVNARAIANGGYDSGGTLKALTQYANDYGSTKANDAYNRYTNDQSNTYNRLAGVSGTGQTAANTIASTGSNAANNISQLQTGMGNASAAGIVGGANAWGSGAQSVSNAANSYLANQRYMALINGNQGGYTGANYPYIGAGSDQYSLMGPSQ